MEIALDPGAHARAQALVTRISGDLADERGTLDRSVSGKATVINP